MQLQPKRVGTDNRDAELCEASRKRLFQVLHVGQASLEGSAMGSNSSELIAQRPNSEKRLLMSMFGAQHPCFLQSIYLHRLKVALTLFHTNRAGIPVVFQGRPFPT